MAVLLRTVVAMLAVASLSSCTPPLTIRLTNASPHALLITYGNAASTSTAKVKAGATVDIRYLFSNAFSIEFDGKRRAFQLNNQELPSVTYEGWSLFMKRVINAEYAIDGCIHMQPKTEPICPVAE